MSSWQTGLVGLAGLWIVDCWWFGWLAGWLFEWLTDWKRQLVGAVSWLFN